ncbi:MAG: hypothetical protein Q8L81_13780 [Bacteroidota bacterium]|nr:hypothetical protein [Bacteroidota bacterium]
MRTLLFALIMICFLVPGRSQKTLTPNAPDFNIKWLRKGKSEMSYYVVNGNNTTEICSFLIDINVIENNISICTKLKFLNSKEFWLDTCILNQNLKPAYYSSYRNDTEYALHFGQKIFGYHFDKKTQSKKVVTQTIKEPFFISYAYPYLLGLLPLRSGYIANFPVYDYKPDGNAITLTHIKEVKSNQYQSNLTGNHSVWQVSVLEEASGDNYEYYIDKETHRTWKIEIKSNGKNILLIDKETDFNPFKTKFDKQTTLKMITAGTAVISGVAFARDNENEGLLKGIAVANIHKKQYAPKGTSVILIPYTSYFKEWIELNEASRKKGKAIPLLEDAAACIKVTGIYDDEGHFEFVNLMPGDYLIYTEFGYTHTSIQTEVVGYTDTYINGMFQGSSANTETYKYNKNAVAGIKKIVKIKKPGEKITIKLKKTF